MKKGFHKLIGILLCVVMVAALMHIATTTSEGLTKAESIGVMIRKTEIEADLVSNEEGFGSLKVNYRSYWDEDDQWNSSVPRTALINREGEFVFPYIDSYYRYSVNNGVVSLTSLGDWVSVRSFSIRNSFYPMGYYSLDGNELFSHNYIICYPMRDGYAMVLEDQNTDNSNDVTLIKGHLINEAGQIVHTFGNQFLFGGAGGGEEVGLYRSYWNPIGQFSEGVIPVEDGEFEREGSYWYTMGAWERASAYYMDSSGNVVLDITPYDYYEFYPFVGGLAKVNKSRGGNYGYINRDGEEVIPFLYSEAGHFQGEYAFVCDSNTGKYGYIDKAGNTVIPFEYDAAYGYGDGLFAVVKDGKGGLVDKDNKVIVPFQYDDISRFADGVGYAIKDGFVHIITRLTDSVDIGGEELSFTAHSQDVHIAAYASDSAETAFTVSCDNACVVAYTTDGGATYTRLAAGGSGNMRSFTVDVTQDTAIVVAMKGDLNLDGKVALADAAQAKRFCAGLRTLTAEQMLAADVVIDGEIKLADAAQIQRFCSGLRVFEW